MKLALSGFPMTGKSTLFQLLTGTELSPHAAPGEAQIAVSRVPDPRLDRLTEMYKPKKKVPAWVGVKTIDWLLLPFGPNPPKPSVPIWPSPVVMVASPDWR